MNALTLHPGKQALFLALSLADLGLTTWLLTHGEGRVYEANPIARWWIDQFGWLGLAGFKGAIVLLVLAVVTLISRVRPQLGGRVLGFGCACLALVVGYSVALGAIARPRPEIDVVAFNAELHTGNDHTRATQRSRQPFRDLAQQLSTEVEAGRCSLAAAAQQLAAFDLQNPHWIHLARKHYPDCTDEQRFACWLTGYMVSAHRAAPSVTLQLASRLEQEYTRTYGQRPPRALRQQLAFLDLDEGPAAQLESVPTFAVLP